MTEALLLAKRNLKFLNREMAYLNQEMDQDYLASACFYTYMVIEFALKHLLEENGLPSNFTHQVKTLVKMCLGYEIAIPEQVLKYYSEMKDWHTEVIYNIEFEGEYEMMTILHPVLNEWVKKLG